MRELTQSELTRVAGGQFSDLYHNDGDTIDGEVRGRDYFSYTSDAAGRVTATATTSGFYDFNHDGQPNDGDSSFVHYGDSNTSGPGMVESDGTISEEFIGGYDIFVPLYTDLIS